MKNKTLSANFDSLIRKWENACLVDCDTKIKTAIADEIIQFYQTNQNKIHFFGKRFKTN